MDDYVELNKRLAVMNGATLYEKVGELKELVEHVRSAQAELHAITATLTQQILANREEGKAWLEALIEDSTRVCGELRDHIGAEIDRVMGRVGELSKSVHRVAEMEAIIAESVCGRSALEAADARAFAGERSVWPKTDVFDLGVGENGVFDDEQQPLQATPNKNF